MTDFGFESHAVFKLGLIINPYAGIGGALALKGSDGQETRAKALSLGAKKQAMHKTRLALEQVSALKDKVHLYVAAGEMGADLATDMGFTHTIVYHPSALQTEGEDSEAAAKGMMKQQVDLLLFAGGDGTARNICHIVGDALPVLGVPAGCKIHSGVFGVTPEAAGRVLAQVVNGEIVSINEAEVMDIDEELFRQGRVKARQYGEMNVPTELRYIQAVKMAGKESDELVLVDIAAHILEVMEDHPEHTFIMGSGSTVEYVMQELNLENSLLGVDVVKGRELLAKDVTAEQLLSFSHNKTLKLVITLIGGQGHILGRGNQQLSAEFIRSVGKDNILVIATKAKLQNLVGRPLIVDSGDPTLDAEFSGLIKVITGYHDQVLYPVASHGIEL